MNRVDDHKIMFHSLIANSGYRNSGILELPSIGFTFVAKWIILGGDDQGWRQTLQFLLLARSQGGHVRAVARLLIGCVEVPAVLHKRASQKATRPKLVIRVSVPTLVIHGDADQIVPIDDSGLLSAKLVKNGMLKVIAGAPHGLCTTHADMINQELQAFLRA